VTVNNPVQAPSGLVAAYGFEEGTGTTTADSSGNALTGSIAAATWATAGKFGKALSFNGTSSMVTVNNAAALGLGTGMTLEAWVNPTTLTNWRTVLLKEQTASNLAYALYANTDTNRPAGNVFTAAETDTRGTAKLATGAWSHLAATYDGATLKLYVNGTLVSSKAATGAIQAGTRALRIGGNAIWSEWFQGLIDEVRVYNRALGAAEIQGDMAVAVKP